MANRRGTWCPLFRLPAFRSLLVLATLVAWAVSPTATARASQATPEAAQPSDADLCASPENEPTVLDLPAMTLAPSDVQIDDLSYGLFAFDTDAELTGKAAELAALWRDVPESPDFNQITETLADIDWNRHYVSVLAVATEDDANVVRRLIRSYVTEYETAAGATAGFDFEQNFSLDGAQGIADYQGIDGSHTVGDQSRIVRYAKDASPDLEAEAEQANALDLAFRCGNLVAGVTIEDYSGDGDSRPAREQIEALADTLVRRINEVRGEQGAGLGTMMVRLDQGQLVLDTYERRTLQTEAVDRERIDTLPLWNELAPEFGERAERMGDAGDVYTVKYQLLEPGGADPGDASYYTPVYLADDPSFSTTVFQFEDSPEGSEQAQIFLETRAAAVESARDYREFTLVEPDPDEAAFGDDEAAVATYSFIVQTGEDGQGPSLRGHLYLVRRGSTVVELGLTQFENLDRAAVKELMTRQVACLDDPAGCQGLEELPDGVEIAPAPGQADAAGTPPTAAPKDFMLDDEGTPAP